MPNERLTLGSPKLKNEINQFTCKTFGESLGIFSLKMN